MPRRTVYLDDATALIIEAAWPNERNFSKVVKLGINALLERMPVVEQNAAFQRAADLLRERMEGTTEGGGK